MAIGAHISRPAVDAAAARIIGRGLGVAFMAGSVAGLVAIWLSQERTAHPDLLTAEAVGGFLLGMAMATGLLDRQPVSRFHILVASGTLLVAVGGYLAGPATKGFEFFYLWSAPYAFVFLRARAIVAHVVLVAASSAAVLWLHSGGYPAGTAWTDQLGTWLLAVVTVVVVGLLVRSLMASVRGLGDRVGATFEQSPIGMAILSSEGRFLEVNLELCRMLGLSRTSLLGTSAAERTWPEHRSHLAAGIRRAHANPASAVQLEKRCVPADDSELWVQLVFSRLNDDVLVQVRDVTAEHHLAAGRLYDPLTGLASRELLLDRLKEMLGEQRSAMALAVVALDIDGFAAINDSLGHDAGDRVLTAVADRLVAYEPAPRTLARLSGDEFVVVYDGVPYPAEVVTLTEGLVETLAAPIGDDTGVVSVTASVGVSIATATSEPAELLRDALTAMHRAKSKTRGRIELFDPGMRDVAAARLRLEQDLRTAISDEAFVLHYQPIVDVHHGRVVCVEALVRWMHPTRGLVAPDAFIPVAEDTGLIDELGGWVVRAAARELGQWRLADPSFEDIQISVNVSARQASNPDRLMRHIRRALAESPGAEGGLVIEITESTLAENPLVPYLLEHLRELDVAIHLDDFGTGYSSFGSLRSYPIDAIKIDRSFIANLDADEQDVALVTAMIGMARTLGLEVVAEGVERTSQLRVLQELGCDYAQGFGICRPVEAAAIGAVLANDLFLS